MVELWVVEYDSVVEVRVEKEEETVIDHISLKFVRVNEGVTHPVVDCGHLAGPHGLLHDGVLVLHVMDGVLDAGVQGEGVLLDTLLNI